MANSAVQAGQPFAVSYTAIDQNSGLFIRASVFDVSAGYPGILVAQLPMVNVLLGSYGANYVGVQGKTYYIVAVVYLDSGFTTPDPDRSVVDYEVQCVDFRSVGSAIVASLAMTGKFFSTPDFKAKFAAANILTANFLGD